MAGAAAAVPGVGGAISIASGTPSGVQYVTVCGPLAARATLVGEGAAAVEPLAPPHDTTTSASRAEVTRIRASPRGYPRAGDLVPALLLRAGRRDRGDEGEISGTY